MYVSCANSIVQSKIPKPQKATERQLCKWLAPLEKKRLSQAQSLCAPQRYCILKTPLRSNLSAQKELFSENRVHSIVSAHTEGASEGGDLPDQHCPGDQRSPEDNGVQGASGRGSFCCHSSEPLLRGGDPWNELYRSSLQCIRAVRLKLGCPTKTLV